MGYGICVLVIGAILVTGCTSTSLTQGTIVPEISTSSRWNSPTNGLTQSHSGGAVTVDVKWLGEKNGNLMLEVAMNTHSVDLDKYDLSKLAFLSDDKGKQYLPVSWDSRPGGHHRQGILTFQAPNSEHQYFHLIIKDLAGVKERAFHWELSVS